MNLAHKVPPEAVKIWAVSYDNKRDAFRVAMADGHIFLLLRPIPEDDHSEIMGVNIEGDGEVFTVLQTSGNEISVPWDVIEDLAAGKRKKPNFEISKRIGEHIKRLRKEKGLTQEQLAIMADMKRPNLSRLEAGVNMPGLPLLDRLADSLQVKISDLVRE